MKLLENTLIQTPAIQLARLSGSHGYRFDGDAVHINAMFGIVHPDAHDHSWALQLWACPSAPDSAHDLAGHLVAEVALPPMGELADETEHFAVSSFAWTPAVAGDYSMVLVLASGRPGEFNEVHDFAVYPRREVFIQPRMTGNVFYHIDGARVQISVGRLENPRPAENLSGTLSLELWALTEPFVGRHFKGHHLAGVEIGALNGQSELTLAPIDSAFTQPPAGNWSIALLLREWTANGFVTRDFTNFVARIESAPVVETIPAPAAARAVAPVVEKPIVPLLARTVTPPVEKAIAPVIEKAVAPVVEKAAAPVIERHLPPVVAQAPAPVIAKSAPPVVAKAPAPAVVSAPVLPVAKTAAPVASVKAPAAPVAKGVSVNTARVEELAAVQGLNTKLAEGIVKKRPYSSLEDLRRVKGVGAAILAKVRSSLRL